DRGGRLLSSAGPGALRAVAVLEPRDSHRNSVLPAERLSDSLGIELLPPVLIIWERWVCPFLRKLWLTGLHITVDTDRGGEEIPLDARARSGVDHVDIDQSAVAHNLALGRMDEPHAAHVGRQLIDGIEAARLQRQRRFTGVLLPQIEQEKVICNSW